MKVRKKKEVEFCGVRCWESGTYGYPCIRLRGHSGEHECLDKDDCPHRWKNFMNEPSPRGTRN